MARLYQFMETAENPSAVCTCKARTIVLALSFLHPGTGGGVPKKVITNE
jgi:hypothetical protein